MLEQRAASLEKEGKWREAASYLRRYLQFEPDDLDARLRLVNVTEHGAETPAQKAQLVRLLYQTIGQMPKPYDLQLKLAALLWEGGEHTRAEAEATAVIDSSPNGEDKRAAERIIALAQGRKARLKMQVSVGDAAVKLREALDVTPGDVALAVTTAELYRDYPYEVGIEDAASQADKIMDRLVETDGANADALIARYNYYRRRYAKKEITLQDFDSARQDLEQVLAKDPNHIAALLLLANHELMFDDKKSRSTAEKRLRKVIDVQPTDPRGHMGLARLQIAQEDQLQATETLLRGRKLLPSSDMDLDGMLVEVLLDLNRLDEAARILSDFDSEFRRRMPELPTEVRLRVEKFSRLVHARLNVARNDPKLLRQASQELEAIIASTGEARTAMSDPQSLHARIMLASAQERLGKFDLAAAQWMTLSELMPDKLELRRRAGVAYLNSGRPQDAIRELNAYVESPDSSPDALIPLVQAHLRQQLLLSPDERNWDEFSITLEGAKAKLPKSWELSLAEVLQLQAGGSDANKQRAMDQLQRLEKTYSSDPVVLEKLVLLYHQLGTPADAERALALYDKCQPNSARQTLLRAALRVQQGGATEAIELLSKALAAASGEDRRQLHEAQIKLLRATGQLEEAQQASSEFIDASPSDAARLTQGIEIALLRRDFDAAARWEEALKRVQAEDDIEWRYFRARRLLGQFATLDARSREELATLILSLQSDRPNWLPVVYLAGQHFDLLGNHRDASEAYRTAVERGDKRPEVFERLVAALYADGRYSEAKVYLERLAAVGHAEDGRIDTLDSAIAFKENRLDDAIKLAKQVVDRGTAGPMQHVWLAQLLSQRDQQDDQLKAEQILQESVDRFPKDPRVWNALFTYFLHTLKQLDKARSVLEEATDKIELDEPGKHFTLAQGYGSLGDIAAAQEHYRAAIAADPKHVEARLKLAESLLSSDIATSRNLIEEVLAIEPKNAQARRYMAWMLAASGVEEDWDRAERLLQSDGDSRAADETVADGRVRAILLSRRGRDRDDRLKNSAAARQILSRSLNQDLDRMLLAGIYEQEAIMLGDLTKVQAACDTLRPLVDRDKPSAAHLITYIQLLLRNLERTSVSGQAPEHREVLLRDALRQIDKLETQLRDDHTRERRLIPPTLRVRTLVLDNQKDEARDLLKKSASRELEQVTEEAERAKLLLYFGNTATAAGLLEDGEEWYRQLLAITPNSYILLAKSLVDQKRFAEAVDVCLSAASRRPPAEVATVLMQLLPAGDINPELEERVRPLIESALKANSDNVNLLISAAVRQVTNDNYDEAIKLFRRVLELQPNHTMALNNLATLLAERPNQLSEARKVVERAMTVSGRSPALLDTLGTILIRGGKNEEAIARLEEAVAGVASDPRFYFHLAVAYQRSGDRVKASEKYERALEYGLDRAILTSADRQHLAVLKQELVPAPDSDK